METRTYKPNTDFDAIVEELSYRVGRPDLQNKEHLNVLIEILKEAGWSNTAITYFIRNVIIIAEANPAPKQPSNKVKIYMQKGEKPPKGRKLYKGPKGGIYFLGTPQEKNASKNKSDQNKIQTQLDKPKVEPKKSNDVTKQDKPDSASLLNKPANVIKQHPKVDNNNNYIPSETDKREVNNLINLTSTKAGMIVGKDKDIINSFNNDISKLIMTRDKQLAAKIISKYNVQLNSNASPDTPSEIIIGALSPENRNIFSGIAGNRASAVISKLLNDLSRDAAVNGKDKSLKNIDTKKTPVFTEDVKPDDNTFIKNNKDYIRKTPHIKLNIDPNKVNFPKKYITVLERLINTEFVPGKTSKITSFVEGAGAGAIRSQAGEILAMMLTSMNDDDAQKLYSEIKQHLKSQDKKTQILTDGWLDAAMNNRTATLNRIKLQYPKGSKIIASSWDVKSEVEALGLTDYNKNKGTSTDVYYKIQLPDGKVVLDEVSLKKDDNVNLLNSSVASYLKWDPNLPDNINIKVYAKEQRDRLENFIKTHPNSNKYLKNPEVQSILKDKHVNINNINDIFKMKINNRDKNKILYAISLAMAEDKNPDAIKFVKEHKSKSQEFAKNTIKAIETNDKIKEGILHSIKNEFPLKSVSIGEEALAIGKNSLDKITLKKLFGTDNYSEIKENLIVNSDKVPPYVAYKAKVGGKEIPIAILATREDGVGYGGNFKFELKLDKRFSKELNKVNQEVYNTK